MAKDKIIVNDNASVIYSEGLEAVVKTNHKKTKIIVPDTKENAQHDGKIVMWGSDNLFPQKLLKEARKNTIIGTTLDKQARIAYEAGIEYGVRAENTGEYIVKFDRRIDQFLKRTKIHRFLTSSLRQFYWFYQVFAEIVLTADRSEVYSIHAHKTAYCRYEVAEDGVPKNCYVSAVWEDAPSLEGKYVSKVPLIDIFADPELYKSEEGFKYIYPIAYSTENEDFYPRADWNSARDSGWTDVSRSIPQFKKALFKNQISIKYLIEVSTWWWNWKYKGFDGFDDKKKKELMTEELEAFQKFMKGEEKSGNTLMTTFNSNPQLQKEYPGWKISAIDDKIKDGIYIEDSNEASSHTLYAIGIDPNIIGTLPGKELAGSGSDKRVAFNIYSDLILPHQQSVLEVLDWINEYNGWGMDFFRFKNLKEKEEPPSKDPVSEPQQQAE
ncbi:MAG: hypothetical protein AAGF85_00680 [Bacteroidota bacterium]